MTGLVGSTPASSAKSWGCEPMIRLLAASLLCLFAASSHGQTECYECILAEYIEQVSIPCASEALGTVEQEIPTVSMADAIGLVEAGLGRLRGFLLAGASEGLLSMLAQIEIADRYRMYSLLREECISDTSEDFRKALEGL